MDAIEVHAPGRTVHAKIDIATELAFGELIKGAKSLGLTPLPVMGLMYLPEQAVTRQFQEACRAVLSILGIAGDNES